MGDCSVCYSILPKTGKMKTYTGIALLAIIISFGFYQKNPLMDAMYQYQMQMQDHSMTGDPDYDFANMMITHRKGGISMANIEISEGTDPKVRDLASDIKESQMKDTDFLKEFIYAHRNTETDTSFVQAMKTHLEKSNNDMQNSMQMKGNTDQLFRTLMAIHHEHSEEMIRIYLKHGKHETLKALAQKMLSSHKSQRILLESIQ
jgi:uncharacterized protein (DUF305 family)